MCHVFAIGFNGLICLIWCCLTWAVVCLFVWSDCWRVFYCLMCLSSFCDLSVSIDVFDLIMWFIVLIAFADYYLNLFRWSDCLRIWMLSLIILIWFELDVHWSHVDVFVDLKSVFSSVQRRSLIWHMWSDPFWSDLWDLNSAGVALGGGRAKGFVFHILAQNWLSVELIWINIAHILRNVLGDCFIFDNNISRPKYRHVLHDGL